MTRLGPSIEPAPPNVSRGGDILEMLQATHPALRRSERKVAAYVIANADRVVRMSLGTLAIEAEVSQPTALRFCRAVGCDGFPDLKIRLAQALPSGAPYVHNAIGPADPIGTVADKIFESSIATLRSIRARLDMAAIDRAVDLIAAARRIDLVGIGLSSVAAIDAHQKFMRLGVPTVYHPDAHLQRMSAATLKDGDVALAFSYTGELRDVVRVAEMARAQGAAVIAVTRTRSALARAASVTVGIDTLENTFVYAPMTTRLAHLAVVDTLATAVALRSGVAGMALIKRVKGALRDEWLIDPDDAPDQSIAPARKTRGRRKASQ